MKALKKIKRTIHYGCTGILILVLSMLWVGTHQVDSARSALSTIIHYNLAAAETAYQVRESLLRQHHQLQKIAITATSGIKAAGTATHPDDEKLNSLGARLLSFQATGDEAAILEKIANNLKRYTGSSRKLIDKIFQDQTDNQIQTALTQANSAHNDLLSDIGEYIDFQKSNAQSELENRQFNYYQLLISTGIVGMIALLVSIIIAKMVSAYVSNKHEELIAKTEQLENVSTQAVKANQLKSAFLATMSHELRTPLTSIVGYAETCLEKNQSMADRISSIKTIIRSSKHLLQIINDILDFTKVEANKLETEKIEFSPFEVLSEIKSVMQKLANDKDLQFEIKYAFPLPEKIESDPLRLKQILLNLCSNAIRFTDRGHVHINVEFNEQNNELEFTVIDTGIGLSAEHLSRIFDIYVQAESETSRKYGGTGLGLALCERLVEKLGGAITVESVENIGSKFHFTIQTGNLNDVRILKHETDIPHIDSDSTNQVVSRFAGHVLVAEDTVDIQNLLLIILRNVGLTVDIANDGKAAVEKALNNEYQLILMDMKMPVLSGIEAIKIIRQKGNTTPIITLTANALPKDRRQCLDAGCDDFVTKPVNRQHLIDTLSKYLQTVEPGQDDTPLTSELLEANPKYITIVENFVTNLPEKIKKLRQYAEMEYWESAKELVHTLKGSGGAFGYQIVTDLSGKIQFQIANENYAEVSALIAELEHVVDRIYSGYVQHHSSGGKKIFNLEKSC